MATLSPGRIGLQLRLSLAHFGVIKSLVCLLWCAGLVAWLWGLPTLQRQDNNLTLSLARAQQAQQAMATAEAGESQPLPEDRLAQFYATLGETPHAEQSLKTVFAIAAKVGLKLNLGEYKLLNDKNGHYQTYQIVVPVKGPYAAIRQFCEQTLLTIPYASLDEVGFKRDSIASPALEAKVRLTLYLSDKSSSISGKVATVNAEAKP